MLRSETTGNGVDDEDRLQESRRLRMVLSIRDEGDLLYFSNTIVVTSSGRTEKEGEKINDDPDYAEDFTQVCETNFLFFNY